ncbi:hypothetical protein SAMN06272759_11922 [Novosphingobium sp. B1]|nr:hypothetical protein SAMN06272759_11922 [Novosphingobium sp. B1]
MPYMASDHGGLGTSCVNSHAAYRIDCLCRFMLYVAVISVTSMVSHDMGAAAESHHEHEEQAPDEKVCDSSHDTLLSIAALATAQTAVAVSKLRNEPRYALHVLSILVAKFADCITLFMAGEAHIHNNQNWKHCER